MEARLAVRTGEERVRALAGRAEPLERAAAEERAARERAAAAARAPRPASSPSPAPSPRAPSYALGPHRALAASPPAAERAAAERARRAADAELADGARPGPRARRRARPAHRLRAPRRGRARRAAAAHRGAGGASRSRSSASTRDAARASTAPTSSCRPSLVRARRRRSSPRRTGAAAGARTCAPSRRSGCARAERALALLGRVNPLALEEFAALEERHQFLTEQLEDLKKTRRDLLDIIREVDERVEQVFTAAYHDTAREFEGVFARLFPGGEGRLVLTDPSDMLTTGIEVEARPPGKKVKRLSLLSGGERSLTAVALLVAIFKARPSPFYVMDEVEAALDDTNLGRLLTIMEELRESSQLIVITHQKRTMEIADALYGVSMRGDGVTTVISQRLREAAAGLTRRPLTAADPALTRRIAVS